MTVTELFEQYPEACGELYLQAFSDGMQYERKAWQERVLSESEANKYLDDLFIEGLTAK